MLENWLSPIDPSIIDESSKNKDCFGNKIQRFVNRIPSLRRTKAAVIGIGEQEANDVRKALYPLTYPFPKVKVADLGNLRNEEPEFIIPVVRELMEGGICPILIGRAGKYTQTQFQAHQACQPSVSIVEVNERVAFHPDQVDSETNYLNPILEGKNKLFHYSTIGSQSHFVSEPVYRFLEKCHFDYLRLGKARGEISGTEPLIRDADMACFHLNAIKCTEAPGVTAPSPTGFTCEEGCQMSRYAGMSDKMTSVGFYGYQSELDPSGLTARTLALLIWYFLDGFNNRQKDFPASMEQLMEYIVELKTYDQQLTFWKSNKTGRWWLQVPVKTKKNHQRHRLIPCSYNDYLLASGEELPERLINAFKRFD